MLRCALQFETSCDTWAENYWKYSSEVAIEIYGLFWGLVSISPPKDSFFFKDPQYNSEMITGQFDI